MGVCMCAGEQICRWVGGAFFGGHTVNIEIEEVKTVKRLALDLGN